MTRLNMFLSLGEGGKGYVPKHFRAQAEDPRHHPQIPEQEKSQRTKGHLMTREHSGLQFSTTLRMSSEMHWPSTTGIREELLPNPIYLSL